MENLKAVLEALILASEVPLALEKICVILEGVEKAKVKETIEQLIVEYNERQSGICLTEVAGGFQFRTRTELSAWVKKLKGTKSASLSPAALETLAIVAYRQPIVKAEIEDIRGVDVSAPLRGLLDKKLIRIVGRKDVPGKPIIYGTTKKFLEVFNLKDLSELPTLRELKELTEQKEPEPLTEEPDAEIKTETATEIQTETETEMEQQPQQQQEPEPVEDFSNS